MGYWVVVVGLGFVVLFLLAEVLLLSSSSSAAVVDLFAAFLPLEAVVLDVDVALGSTVVGAKCGKSGCGIVRSRVM